MYESLTLFPAVSSLVYSPLFPLVTVPLCYRTSLSPLLHLILLLIIFYRDVIAQGTVFIFSRKVNPEVPTNARGFKSETIASSSHPCLR